MRERRDDARERKNKRETTQPSPFPLGFYYRHIHSKTTQPPPSPPLSHSRGHIAHLRLVLLVLYPSISPPKGDTPQKNNQFVLVASSFEPHKTHKQELSASHFRFTFLSYIRPGIIFLTISMIQSYTHRTKDSSNLEEKRRKCAEKDTPNSTQKKGKEKGRIYIPSTPSTQNISPISLYNQ